MEEEAMLLTTICPETQVPGFVCDITRKSESILGTGSLYDTLFIDYYLQVSISNNGTNSAYPHPFILNVLVTQYVEPCNIGIAIGETDAPTIVIALQHYETLIGITIVEMTPSEETSVVCIVRTKDSRCGTTATQVWGLATVGHKSFQEIPHNESPR